MKDKCDIILYEHMFDKKQTKNQKKRCEEVEKSGFYRQIKGKGRVVMSGEFET